MGAQGQRERGDGREGADDGREDDVGEQEQEQEEGRSMERED